MIHDVQIKTEGPAFIVEVRESVTEKDYFEHKTIGSGDFTNAVIVPHMSVAKRTREVYRGYDADEAERWARVYMEKMNAAARPPSV